MTSSPDGLVQHPLDRPAGELEWVFWGISSGGGPDALVQQPLDRAAGELEWLVVDKRGGGDREQRDEHRDSQIGRGGQAVSDGCPAGNRGQREERQGQRGRELQPA